ncbi:MAG TPA: chemotaxis protein CheW [Polyangiaceae bacterium]|nr:chemotaxis protein CheW [Polyangiaceae bacterium]
MHQRLRHDPSKSLVGFLVGDVHYAVPVARVKEITNPMPLVELPHAPASVAGVADLRGELCAVVDLRQRFGLSPSMRTRKTKWIVVDVETQRAALVVDAVTEVFGTGGTDLRAPPSLGGGDDRRGIAGVTNHAGTLVFVLDTTRIRDLVDPIVLHEELLPGPRISALPPETRS